MVSRGGTVWGGLGSTALLEEVLQPAWAPGLKSLADFQFILCFLLAFEDVSYHLLLRLPVMMDSYPSGAINPPQKKKRFLI